MAQGYIGQVQVDEQLDYDELQVGDIVTWKSAEGDLYEVVAVYENRIGLTTPKGGRWNPPAKWFRKVGEK